MNPKQTVTSPLYDMCNYKAKLQESLGPYNWITQNVRENPEACNNENSPFMQQPFFSIPKDKIDIESELRNETRKLSRCPENKYTPFSGSTCKECTKCDTVIPCDCLHCKTKEYHNGLKECIKSKLTPEYTKKNKSCDNPEVYINRFSHLNEDLQDSVKIHPNSYIGIASRNMTKDLKTVS